MFILSKYADSLPCEAKVRYQAKISLIGGVDLFSSGKLEVATSEVPPVEMCDLASYLVLRMSFLTMKQFKARKGLEAYNQFVSGWVKDVRTQKVLGNIFQ